ncbi:hypothetical protein B0H13DRAFT_188489 [Mycena leptocephala]|nr:hypothetical protein B0H13DRAFT_188489 [Mycena leptocephala]
MLYGSPAQVFAGNLPYYTTNEELKTFFGPVESEIISVRVMRGKRPRRYGFVALKSPDAVHKAIDTLHQKELNGRKVQVKLAHFQSPPDPEKDGKSLNRRDKKPAPADVAEAEASGGLAVNWTKTSSAGRNAEAKNALAAANASRATLAMAATPSSRVPEARTGRGFIRGQSKSVLFVTQLGFEMDDDGLVALFSDAGIPVTSACIVRRRRGQPRQSKGYGFVDVGGEEGQKKAIASLHGKEVGGKSIVVKIAANTLHDDDVAGYSG